MRRVYCRRELRHYVVSFVIEHRGDVTTVAKPKFLQIRLLNKNGRLSLLTRDITETQGEKNLGYDKSSHHGLREMPNVIVSFPVVALLETRLPERRCLTEPHIAAQMRRPRFDPLWHGRPKVRSSVSQKAKASFATPSNGLFV